MLAEILALRVIKEQEDLLELSVIKEQQEHKEQLELKEQLEHKGRQEHKGQLELKGHKDWLDLENKVLKERQEVMVPKEQLVVVVLEGHKELKVRVVQLELKDQLAL